MLEMAIIAMIVAKVGMDSAGKLAVDVGFGVRGRVSPRLAEARRRRPRGAASAYFSELWADAWGDMARKHNDKRAGRAWDDMSRKQADREAGRPSTSRPRGAATSFFAGWLQDRKRAARKSWEDVWIRQDEKRREKATRPRPGQVTVPGTVVPNAQDEDRPEPTTVPAEDDMPVRPAEDDQDEPTDPIRQDGDQSVPDSVPDYVPDFGPDNDPSPTATPTTEGTTIMSTITGEVIGLDQTLRFCNDSAKAYSEMVHQIEQAQAALGEGDVTGPAAAAFASAMDQSQAAAASLTAAAQELKKHRAIAEAIDSVQGAGKREFYTAGR